MRTRLATLLILAGLALQPALAGGWGHRGERRPPPPPPRQQFRPPEPQRQPQIFAPPQQPRPQNFQQQRPVSRDEAIRRAQQMNGGGRVLAADPAESGYRVRVLKDGEVRSVYVPGQ